MQLVQLGDLLFCNLLQIRVLARELLFAVETIKLL